MKVKLFTAAILSSLVPLLASAQSAGLSMNGSIVPTACTPALSAGGVVDLGRTMASALNTTVQTLLRKSDSIELTVTCGAATRLALEFLDNDFGTLAPGVAIPDTASTRHYFGLGAVGAVNIGGYALLVETPPLADGAAMVRIERPVSGGGWSVAALPALGNMNSIPSHQSWGVGPATGPIAARVHVLNFLVASVIRKGEDLPLASEVPLSGSVTLTLNYP